MYVCTCTILSFVFCVLLSADQRCGCTAAADGSTYSGGGDASGGRHTRLLYTIHCVDDPVHLLQLVCPLLYHSSYFPDCSGMGLNDFYHES